MVESDVVEGLLEIPANQLIINECLLWQEMQVLLEGLTNEVLPEATEERLLRRLSLEEGEHAPGDADNREVLLVFKVLIGGELHDLTNCIQVLIIFVAFLRVTWDVHAVEVCKFALQNICRLRVVNRYHTCTASLQEVGMGSLKEALVGELVVIVPNVGQRLCEHSDDGLVRLCTRVVTNILKNRLALVTAQMLGALALYHWKRQAS